MQNLFSTLFLIVLVSVSQAGTSGGLKQSLPDKNNDKKKPELIFCVDNWSGLTNLDGTGSYSELVHKVFDTDYQVKIKIFPWARAQNEFRADKCTSLMAENKVDKKFIQPKIVLDALELQAYFLKGNLRFQGEKTLKTKELAWLRGYNFHKILDYPVRFTEFNSVHAGFKMLEARRFEVMLDYVYSFKDECQSSGANCGKIDSAPSGIIERSYVIFHNNEEGLKLAKIWDERMAELIRSGKAQKIFEKFGQKYPVQEVPAGLLSTL